MTVEVHENREGLVHDFVLTLRAAAFGLFAGLRQWPTLPASLDKDQKRPRMFGKTPRISPLELRKQLLLAESELNRAQLVHEFQTVADGVRALANRAKSFGSICSSTAMVVGALAAFRRGTPSNTSAKPSRLQSILKSAGLVTKLWMAFRPPAPRTPKAPFRA